MDRRVLVGIAVVGVLALVGIGMALQPPPTEPSAVKTLAPRPSAGAPAAPPDETYVPPKPPATAAGAATDAPTGSPEAVEAHRETEFRDAITETMNDTHVACMLEAGISHSVFADIPIAVTGGKVDADCSRVDPDLKTMCGCLEQRIEEMAELSVYDGMSWVYPLEIYMKD